ncbi:MAG: hypothetical protein WKG07_40620 [Hymenobacter sp.]
MAVTGWSAVMKAPPPVGGLLGGREPAVQLGVAGVQVGPLLVGHPREALRGVRRRRRRDGHGGVTAALRVHHATRPGAGAGAEVVEHGAGRDVEQLRAEADRAGEPAFGDELADTLRRDAEGDGSG